MLNPSSFTQRILRFALAAAVSGTMATAALGQAAWPNKPIRLLVGFPPGGTVDVMARTLADQLTTALGQPVIVDTKPGASGNLAAGEVVKAAPDGYTLLVSSTSVETANPSLFKAPFAPATDLHPINSIGRAAIYLIAKPNFEATDVKGLVAIAKARPGTLSYGSAGVGTQLHLAAELFKQNAGFEASHVPYKGAAPAVQDVMGGQTDFVLDPGISLPFVQAGKVKLLGVLSSRRSSFFPQVPTLAEQGIPGTELDIWFGIWAPRGTPLAIAERLNRELSRLLEQPVVRERFAKFGAEPAVIGGPAFQKLLVSEREVFSRLIRERHITAD